MKYIGSIISNTNVRTVELCFERLKKAGVHPSELTFDGLVLLLMCAERDRLAALRAK